MNSRVSWSIDGIDPSVRERAEAAARRAGMSLNDWLNSTVGDPTPPNFRNAIDPRQDLHPDQPQVAPSRGAQDVADIHQRLDSITRQIEQISRPAPRNDPSRGEQGVARQLNDAISRLDARLSQISNPQASRQGQQQDKQRQAEMVERAASQVYAGQVYSNQAYRKSPPLSPASLDSAIAEITARQHELDDPPAGPLPSPVARQIPQRSAPPIASPMAQTGPDFSSLERHLFKITSQIEALQRPDHLEQSIAAFRSELAEIRTAITEAMPRRAIESIEGEIRSLSRRIDDTRHSGIDRTALAGIERALAEIREVLRSLTPAEQLAGYDDAIRNLGAKLDLILRSNDDPGTVQQLEGAIAALRAIVSNVASNDALARLSDDVRMLSSKVDQLAQGSNNADSLVVLEQRIAALTSTLESRERPVQRDNSDQLEGVLRSLSDRLDRIPVGPDNASAFAHLEQRVSQLLQRLEAFAEHRPGNLSEVEDGLQDILRHLERQHLAVASLAGTPQATDTDLVDTVKRELSDIRYSQSETDRRTQDSLETVHNTLGHVVDRLAMIEGDLRAARAAPEPGAPPAAVSAPAPIAAEPEEMPSAAKPQAAAPQLRPELPNPAAAQAHFVAAPREFQAAEPREFQAGEPLAPTLAPVPPRAISEILEPHAAAARPAVAPGLAPDHPLEPGTRPSARAASPSERIAASESAISEIPAAARAPVSASSSSSFIAAARRAAQAAAAAPVNGKSGRGAANVVSADKARARNREPSSITTKIRSLLVAASVVVIVLATFKMAMGLLDTGPAPQPPAVENSGEPQPQSLSPADNSAAPAPAAPSITSPTPLGRQSNNSAAPNMLDSAQVTIPPLQGSTPSDDVTATIPASPRTPATGKLAAVQPSPTGRLPDAIGGPVLRAAASKGDPTAAYEVGVRFAEGKGIDPDLDEAAKWYDRAAQAGIVPAVFRLGTLYEKGLGVKKDAELARHYYLQAAERGNAKAMHNLAVLDADGGGKGANYKSASQWFRKAADRGVADSQFNLGILYARGIGVEQNLAESFKWFSLAAAQGDADAAHKRDDIAKRLDAQSLAAAKLAIQTFAAEPQPDDAVNVATPPGGWDSAPAQARAAKAAAKPVSTKRAAR